LLLSLGKGFWKNQWVLSRVKIIGSNGGDVSLPTFRVGITFLSISPSIVSLFIGFNLRLGIVIWNVSLSLLSKNSSSWGKSATIVGNPVKVVSGGGVSLSTPGHLVGLVVLGIVPGMVSLSVWGDVGSAITNWVDLLLSLNKSFWKNQWVLSRVKIIGSNSGDVSLPFSLISLISLVISPGIISLFISRDC